MNDKIIYFENFLSQEECDIFIKEASEAKEEMWQTTGQYSILKSSNHREIKNIKKRLDKVFDNKFNIQKTQMIHRTDIFSKWDYHSDDQASSNTRYGIVIYLNDDFEGGLTTYKKIDSDIKPKSGAMIIHPADSRFEHTVTEVTSGLRYTLTSFARDYL